MSEAGESEGTRVAEPTLTPKVNSHVMRLDRHLPFSASHDQIYEEYQTGEDGLNLDTVALDYAIRALRNEASCIVLTGDAGHGKTHMCRRILEEYLGYPSDQARAILLSQCDGKTIIKPANGQGRGLRIHKDFSEIEPAHAATFLERVSNESPEALVVCANEGRLRAVLSAPNSGKNCLAIRSVFLQSFSSGLASSDGSTHIVNLNYQSVAAGSDAAAPSLVRRTLHNWVADGRRWGAAACGSCSFQGACPIKRNRALLAEEDKLSDARVTRLEQLLATVERLGAVVTIREMLMLVAYIITGGLTCVKVHQMAAKPRGWQHLYSFYNLLFQATPEVPQDQLIRGIPVLSVLRRLDPGAVANREVDERLLNQGDAFDPGQLDLEFRAVVNGTSMCVDISSGIDDLLGNPQSRAEQARENEVSGMAVASLRRRAFFDDPESSGTLMARLGFRYGDDFLKILSGRMEPRLQVKLKNLMVAGLHAVQGLRMQSTETMLHLVDPAFGQASADAAIIARRIPTSAMQLIPAERAMSSKGSDWGVASSVDWIDRAVVVRIQEGGGAPDDIALDVLSFECVARTASGYISEGFYAHEIRRLRTFLGKLAESGRSQDGQIALFMDGRIQSISLDMGVIQVGGGA